MKKGRKSAIERVAHNTRLAFRHGAFRLRGLFQDTVTIQTKQGLLTMSTRDMGIAAPLYRHGEYEFELSLRAVQFLKRRGFIPQTNVCMMDVGANIGLIGIGLLLADELASVFAIEPEPDNFELLLRNRTQNGLENRMRCLQAAIGESEGTLKMELSLDNRGDHRIRAENAASVKDGELYRESNRRTIDVPSMPLARALEQPKVCAEGMNRPHFMWIDVQGYEGHVFNGAAEVLGGGMPTVSEIWPYGIRRSGMTPAQFLELVGRYWNEYWLDADGEFIGHPITAMDALMAELERTKRFANVIFTKSLKN